MRAVIDVGGGTRDIFGAGVFDYFLEHEVTFDRCYGVSAGVPISHRLLPDSSSETMSFILSMRCARST